MNQALGNGIARLSCCAHLKEVKLMFELILWVNESEDDLIDLFCCPYNFFASGLDPLDDELIVDEIIF